MKFSELKMRLIALPVVLCHEGYPVQLEERPVKKLECSINRWHTSYAFIALAMFALSLCALPAKGQGFGFNDFSSTAGLTLLAPAAQSGNVLRLTPGGIHQVGGAWFNTAQPVAGGFTTIFTFQISNPNNGNPFPADGIAFVIQNDTRGAGALGGDGGCIGYSADAGICDNTVFTGISNSLAVELDTFQNGTTDPDANHIAVQSCGTAANSSLETGACKRGTAPNAVLTAAGLNLHDGNPHTLQIVYDPNASCGEFGTGTLNINLLNTGTNLLSVCIGDLASLLGLGVSGGKAFVGFTGSTGADVENNDILNWQWASGASFTTTQQPIVVGDNLFTDGNVPNLNQLVHLPSGTDTGGAMFMSVSFIKVAQSDCNQILAESVTNGPNSWSGGRAVDAGSTCTIIAGTGNPSPANDTPIITQNLCFDSGHNLIFPCNITAPSAGTPITLTSQYGTESGLKQTNPAYFMCSDDKNDCANIFTTDPCLTGCTVTGGTLKINSREIIGSGPFSALVQQPINADGSSVFSAKRGVIPVKFTLTVGGVATCMLPQATIALFRTATATSASVDESIYLGSADTSSNFRISGCQYIYNLPSGSLGPGMYEVDILIQNSLVGSAVFALK